MKNLEILKLTLTLQFKLDLESGECKLTDNKDLLYLDCYGDCYSIEETPNTTLFNMIEHTAGRVKHNALTIVQVLQQLDCL